MDVYKYLLLMLLIISATLSGCASNQTLSSYARTGDTVMISLGGEHQRTTVAVLKKENITVTITDYQNNTYPVKLRHLMKVQPDLASRMNTSGLIAGSWEYSLGAYQGLWLGIIDLVDPVTGSAHVLEPGQASLSVTGAGLISDGTPFTGDLNNVPIEILPGAGNYNPLSEYTQFGNLAQPLASLEPIPQVDISPDPSGATQQLGGASIIIQYTDSYFPNSMFPRAVPATQDPNIQLMSNLESQGDGTTLHKIFIMNPHGINTSNSKSGLSFGVSDLRNLSIRLAWQNNSVTDVNDANWQNAIQLLSEKYVSINGDVLPVSSVVSKVR